MNACQNFSDRPLPLYADNASVQRQLGYYFSISAVHRYFSLKECHFMEKEPPLKIWLIFNDYKSSYKTYIKPFDVRVWVLFVWEEIEVPAGNPPVRLDDHMTISHGDTRCRASVSMVRDALEKTLDSRGIFHKQIKSLTSCIANSSFIFSRTQVLYFRCQVIKSYNKQSNRTLL